MVAFRSVSHSGRILDSSRTLQLGEMRRRGDPSRKRWAGRQEVANRFLARDHSTQSCAQAQEHKTRSLYTTRARSPTAPETRARILPESKTCADSAPKAGLPHNVRN